MFELKQPHFPFHYSMSQSDVFVMISYVVRALLALCQPHSDTICAPQLDVDGHIDSVIVLLSPRQVHLLLDMVGAFSGGGGKICYSLCRLPITRRRLLVSGDLIAPSFLCEGAQEWSKDRKSRPIQQEDEYRLHMELNRCLKKDTDLPGGDPDLFQSHATRATSSRGWATT